MKLLCLLFVACLLALLTSCESFLLVVKSGCGRAPAQRFLMSTINDLPTRVALLEQSLGTTNEKLTTIVTMIDSLEKKVDTKIEKLDTKIDNLSKDTKKMVDNLSKDTKKIIDALDKKVDTKIDAVDKKLDQILSKLDTFSNSTTDKLNNHKVWLFSLTTFVTTLVGMSNIKDVTGLFNK